MSRRSNTELYELLFQAALVQVRERGYRRASVSDITDEAGVAKGTFFNYFPSKDHLLSEVLHRIVERALAEVRNRATSGTEAILTFSHALAEGLAEDRVLTEAVVVRLSALPSPPGSPYGAVREEERIRSWIEARLSETLPITVPLTETDPRLLAFLLTWAIRGTVDEWIHGEGESEALRGALSDRVGFLLESAGLPTMIPTDGASR